MRFFSILTFLLFFIPEILSAQRLTTYTAPDSLPASTFYRVNGNGIPLFVYQNEVSSLVYFSMVGKVEVEITTTHDVKWVDVRPKHLDIPVSFRGNTIRFTLEQPCNLSIELNGEHTNPLYLFAAPPETQVPMSKVPGVRYFEGGKIHNVGTITLASDETVYIAGGAIVRGNIIANDARNIRIRGRGILDGTYEKKQLIELNRCQDIQIEGIIVLNSPGWTIVPRWSNRLLIDNIKQVCWRNGSDGVDLVSTSHVRITDSFFRNNDDNIVIKSWGGDEKYPIQAPKGPDVSDILITKSVFWNMAWGNALEIGFELQCGSVNDITFRDCDLIHVERGAAFSIHNGDYATVENVRYENIRVEDAPHKLIDLAVFLSQYSMDRPPTDEARREGYLQGAWDGVQRVAEAEKARYATNRGHIRNITFLNIAVTDGQFPFSILSGFDLEHRIENVRIQNLTIHGRRIKSAKEGRFFLENTDGIVFK